jgi:predicted HTH transcriptional regulator
MFLSELPLERHSEADLQRLIADGVRESRDLDFKRDAVGDDRDAKREFLRDVTSFANAAGGYLLIGMAEAAGVADALIGLTTRPPDDEKLRLENVIRDGVEPRLGYYPRCSALFDQAGNWTGVPPRWR